FSGGAMLMPDVFRGNSIDCVSGNIGGMIATSSGSAIMPPILPKTQSMLLPRKTSGISIAPPEKAGRYLQSRRRRDLVQNGCWNIGADCFLPQNHPIRIAKFLGSVICFLAANTAIAQKSQGQADH